MMTYEYDGKILIIDCGVLFPEEHQPGVDLILPDFESIRDRLDDIEGIVLTHGHEDHIGAVPYLLKLRETTSRSIGSGLTLALDSGEASKSTGSSPIVEKVVEGERWDIGPFDLEFIAVNHSIPDALAVAVRTPAGMVLHTGDFKMDQLPLDGRITDMRAFARLGEEGVDLFLARLDERRRPRLHAHRAADRPRHRSGHLEDAWPGDRRELLEPRPPRAAGAGRGGEQRSSRRPARARAWCGT